MKYGYTISHFPGKSLFTADTLSLAPSAQNFTEASVTLQEETEAFVAAILAALPATQDYLDQFWKAEAADKTLSQVIKFFCKTKWPKKPS